MRAPRPVYRDPQGIIPDEIMEGFMVGFDAEHYLVAAIKQYLLTQIQRTWLFKSNLDITDLLNGRIEDPGDEAIAEDVFATWNARLGAKKFGF